MTNLEILEKAVLKATAQGWLGGLHDVDFEWSEIDDCYVLTAINSSGTVIGMPFDSVSDIIFNHDFAKALWGYEGHYTIAGDHVGTSWQYHLQQMVIENNRFKYLGENI